MRCVWISSLYVNASILYSGMPSHLLSFRTSSAFWSVKKRSMSSRSYCVTAGPVSASRKPSPAPSLAEGPLPDLPSSAWDHLRCWPVATTRLLSHRCIQRPRRRRGQAFTPPRPPLFQQRGLTKINQGNECVSEQEREREQNGLCLRPSEWVYAWTSVWVNEWWSMDGRRKPTCLRTEPVWTERVQWACEKAAWGTAVDLDCLVGGGVSPSYQRSINVSVPHWVTVCSWENGVFVNVYVSLSVLHVGYKCYFLTDLIFLLKFLNSWGKSSYKDFPQHPELKAALRHWNNSSSTFKI